MPAASRFPTFALSVCAAIEKRGERLGFVTPVCIFFGAVLIIVSRRIDSVSYPQFFAEDGTVWFADAYNLGWFRSLLVPYAGYMVTFPRLAAALALSVPFENAPLIMNAFGIVAQALPVVFLMSSRCAKWGSPLFRGALALLYLLLPNASEIHVTVTNAQWHLTLLAALIVIAERARTLSWRIFDIVLLLLCGLTGPFCILLTPLAARVDWKARERSRLIHVVILTAASVTQATVLWQFEPSRPAVPLAATIERFISLCSGHVFLGAIIGPNITPRKASPYLLGLVFLGGGAFMGYCLAKATLEWKFLIVFCGLVLSCSLAKPFVKGGSAPAWVVLETVPGIRYWFLPSLAFAWSLLWCASHAHSRSIKIAASAALIAMCFGMALNYRIRPYQNLKFQQVAAQFDRTPDGSAFVIPSNPSGWVLRLIKHK